MKISELIADFQGVEDKEIIIGIDNGEIRARFEIKEVNTDAVGMPGNTPYCYIKLEGLGELSIFPAYAKKIAEAYNASLL